MIINKYRHCIGCVSYISKDEAYISKDKECKYVFVMPNVCPCQNCLIKTMCHKPCDSFKEYYADEKGIPPAMRNVHYSAHV